MTRTVVEEVVAAGLRGFLAKKTSPGGILSARTANLRDWHVLDHQSELAILLPNASAEKRTSEQPTGKRTSVTPRDKRLGLGLERIVVVPGSRDADPHALDESNARFANEVLPALRD